MTHPTEWIYLFGSNTRALYAVDALNTLALPRGWKLHYRYEKRHVDDRLWQSLVAAGNNPSALGGARLVLNFVNQETVTSSEGKISYRPIEFFPLRTGQLSEHGIDGSVAHFWFTVQDYLRYERSGQATDFPWQVQSRIQDACGQKTPFHRIYATWGNAEPFRNGGVVNDTEATAAFQSTVMAISDHGFRGDSTIFARFHGLTERTPGPVETDRTVSVSYDQWTHKAKYILDENKVYQIGVTIYNAKSLSLPAFADVALELAFDPSVFIALDQKRISISGRVDQPSFVVTTRKVTDDQPSFLRISSDPGITRKDASEVSLALLNDFRGPDWTIPVEVHTDRKAKRWRLIKRSIAEGLVAVFTVATASILSRFISGDPSKPIEPWVIPAIIFSLSLVVVGIGWRIKLDETKTK